MNPTTVLSGSLPMGTLFEIKPQLVRNDTSLTPIFFDPVECEEKLGWLDGYDIVMTLEVADESDKTTKRVRVLSRLGVGWVSKMWIRTV